MNILENGIDIKKKFLHHSIIQSIIEDVSTQLIDMPKHGVRNAEKKFPSIGKLVTSELLIKQAAGILGSKPALVRTIFFDKTPSKNWFITWHQDKTIAVNNKKNIPMWGPWSVKDGVVHVQPDVSVLNSMVAFRLHLDDADENNGCLKVIPGSHKKGLLSQSEIQEITRNVKPYLCEVKAGDLVMLRPHLLHSSCKSALPKHRRVVHVEYSNYNLPMGLEWI